MKTATNTPRWSDEEGVAALVDDEFLEWERIDAMDAVVQVLPDIKESEIFASMEHEAVAAAERGDFNPLAKILEQKNPLIKQLSGKFQLGEKARAILAERITGRDAGKRGPGRPKQSIEERYASSKCHGAADALPDIERILGWHYPDEKGIRERAITIAADRAGIRRQTLENYLRSDRRLP